MKLTVVLPWVCVGVCLVGLGMLYSFNQKQAAELTQLRDEHRQKLRAAEEANRASAEASSEELVRLRKDNADLLRLRNEVRQLRGEKQQLTTQLQAAETQAKDAQASAEALRLTAAQAAQVAQATRAAQAQQAEAAFRARYGLPPTTPEQGQANACINNLRQIDGAKQQWALENRKTEEAVPTAADLASYLKSNSIPNCPAGGSYNINAVGVHPTCSQPGHAIPK